ncbi:Major facilitator superfamily domain general substrate transporter [Penicillium herquei]|nr:Major facilitator superfamily domain general substrate transporter [Penicillium herquei]
MASILGVLMPGIMTVGYNTASLGGVLSLESFKKNFPEIDIAHADNKDHASTLEGALVASYAIGTFLGTFCCIWLGDILGRRRTMLAGAVVQLMGYALNTSAYSFGQLFVSRLIVGIGTGALLATVPLWISETSPAKRRGSHVATKGIFSGLGCASALFLEYGLSFKKHTSLSWRLPFGFPTVLSLTLLLFVFFLPESPRWLIRKGRVAEARVVLAALADIDVDCEKIDNTISEVQTSLNLAGGDTSFKLLFQMGPQRTFHRAILAIGGLVFLQFTGATVTTYYSESYPQAITLFLVKSPHGQVCEPRHANMMILATAIFESNLGLKQSTARLLAAVYQLVGPLGATLCVFIIERAGRRRLMLGSAIGNTICLACIAGLGAQTDNINASHGAVFFLFLFHFCYIIGFGGIPYLYATEIAPLHLRSTINSVSISIGGAISILIAHITPIAFNSMGEYYFLIYAGLNAAMAPAIFFLFPETSGRSLEEIDDIFTLSESAFATVRVARRLPCFPSRQGIEGTSPTDEKPKMDTVFKEKEIPV